MAGRRLPRWARVGGLFLGLGAGALALAACTLTAKSARIHSTGTAQMMGTIFGSSTDTSLHLEFRFSITGSGSLSLTPVDDRITPTFSSNVSGAGPCHVTPGTPQVLTCGTPTSSGGTATMILSGVRVNTTGGQGTVTVSTPQGYIATVARFGTNPAPAVTARRVSGQTADATAVAELQAAFGDSCPGSTGTRPVVLATDQGYPDALASSYLASSLKTGTLLTPTASLSAVTRSALQLGGITHVYVVGGPLAVSTAVVDSIQALPASTCGGSAPTGQDIAVTRIAGATAYTTAAHIAQTPPPSFVGSADLSGAYGSTNATGGQGRYNATAGSASGAPGASGAQKTAILATGTSFQDAEAAGVLAYANHLPILLSTPAALAPQAQAAIGQLGVTQVIVMGGPLAISDNVVSQLQSLGVSVVRVAGADGSATSVELANLEAASPVVGSGLGWDASHRLDAVAVARGDGFSDGLAGAVAAATGGAGGTGPEPLLLTESPVTVGTALGQFLREAGIAGIDHDGVPVKNLTVLGGPLAITTASLQLMKAYLGG